MAKRYRRRKFARNAAAFCPPNPFYLPAPRAIKFSNSYLAGRGLSVLTMAGAVAMVIRADLPWAIKVSGLVVAVCGGVMDLFQMLTLRRFYQNCLTAFSIVYRYDDLNGSRQTTGCNWFFFLDSTGVKRAGSAIARAPLNSPLTVLYEPNGRLQVLVNTTRSQLQ